jgi:hypothetical protein
VAGELRSCEPRLTQYLCGDEEAVLRLTSREVVVMQRETRLDRGPAGLRAADGVTIAAWSERCTTEVGGRQTS